MIVINNLEEMKEYYDEKMNTYVFKDDVKFNCNIDAEANISAWDINACSINTHNINAWSINAEDISAWDINAGNINAWNINALDINAWNINAWDINAGDINAYDINAKNIDYFAACFAYKNIRCKSIKGGKKYAKHFVLDGKLEIKGE